MDTLTDTESPDTAQLAPALWIHFLRKDPQARPWIRLWKLLFRPRYTHVVYEIGPGAVYEYGLERQGWYDAEEFFSGPQEWDTVELRLTFTPTTAQMTMLSAALLARPPLEVRKSIRYFFTRRKKRFFVTPPWNCASVGALFLVFANLDCLRGTPDELYSELEAAAESACCNS